MIGKLTRKLHAALIEHSALSPRRGARYFALLFVMLLMNTVSQAQTILSENFATASGTTPPTGWVQNYIVGSSSNKWAFNNPGGRTLTLPISSPAAIFDSDNLGSGAGAHTVALESPSMNTTGKSVVKLKFDHYFHRIYNSSDSIVVEVHDGTDWNIVYYSQSSTAISGNIDIDISAYAANKSSTKVRFKFRGNWSWYWIVDNVEVYEVPVCSGTPNPGNTVASANPACLSTSPTLSLQNTTVGSGVTYQWQSSPTGVTWSNISGATSATYSPTATAYYRCNVTCSGNTGTSSSLLFTLTNFMTCYCIPPIGGQQTWDGCQDDDEILNVTMGTLNNNTTCASTSSVIAYRDFGGSVAAPTFNLGSSYTLYVTGANIWEDNIVVWIDYNHNGIFDASEYTNLGTTNGNNTQQTLNSSIQIPTSALTGLTKMRVKLEYDNTQANTSACAGYDYGECQDYNVEIVCAATISAQPVDASICAGANTSFSITASNANSYKWQVSTDGGTNWSDVSNGGVYSNATTSTLTITGAPATMHGYKYRGLATNTAGACAATSNVATLTVQGITGTTPGFACAGAATSVSATPAGGTITWYDQATGGTNLGAGNTLNIPVAPGSNTTYYAQAASCPARTAVLLSVNTAAAVSAHPSNATICETTNTSFSVTATNVASYQWQVSTNGGTTWSNVTNTGVYSNATTATLNITSATLAMNNYRYRVELTTSCSIVTNSNSAILTVNPAPTVTLQPVDKTICAGNATSFQATGTGSGTITYQWQLSTNSGVSWGNISNGGVYSGATSNQLNITGTTTALNGNMYRAVISGGCSPAATTNSALLTVNSLPAVVSSPSSVTICTNANTSFTCSGTGSGITYQWQVSTNNGVSYSNISNTGVYSNATTATLNLTSVPASMDGYMYRCRIDGVCPPTVFTGVAKLTIGANPAITAHPQSKTICTGTNGSTGVTATGYNLSYQWEVSTNGGTTWANVLNGGIYSGATTNTLQFNSPTLAVNGNMYRCVVTNACAVSVTSNAMTLTVANPAVVTTQPTNKTVCLGDNTSYTVAATSSAPISYQWQGSTNGTTWSNLSNTSLYSGVTTPTLTVTGVFIGIFTHYRCELNTGCIPPVTSATATLTMHSQPVISSNPSNQVKCVGQNATFSVSATGSNLTYQWQISTNGGSTWANVTNGGGYSGATTFNLAVSNVQASQNGYRYRCVVSGSCPTIKTSGSATLTVNTPVVLTANTPASITLCSGDNTSLTVGATGTGVSYRWYINNSGTWTALNNGGFYSGVTTSTLNITGITAAPNTKTYIYYCVVTGACNMVGSNYTYVTVHAKPAITSNPVSVTRCDSTQNVSFSVGTTGTGLTYQWQINTGTGWFNLANNSTYSGVTTPTLLLSWVYYSMNNYQYRCIITGTCSPAVTSSVATLTINQLVQPSVSIAASSQDICAGTNVTFTASPVNGGSATYVWKRNGTAIGTGNPFTTSALSNGQVIICEMTSNAVCPVPKTVASNPLTMKVTQYSTPTIAITSDHGSSWCSGKDNVFRATITNGGDVPTYEWLVNGQPVGASADTYLTNQLVDGDKVSCKLTSNLMCPSPQTVTSNVITMTINQTTRSSIVIAPNPDSVVCDKTEVTMYSFFTNGGTTPSFQWVLNGQDIPGETMGTLTTTGLSNGDVVQCRFISSATCVFPEMSNPVTFNVNPLINPSVTVAVYQIGEDAYRFTAIPKNGGLNPAYQWYKNTVPIPGATAETYDATGLIMSDKIHVEMSSSEACVNPELLTVSSRNITTGVEKFANGFSELGLYPNPNGGQFHIKGALNSPVSNKEMVVKITNSLGQVVFAKTYPASGSTIDLPVVLNNDLANGMYQVNIVIDGEVSNLRFVLNR